MKMSGEKAIHRQELERGLLTQKISRLFLKYTIPGVAGLLFLGIQSVIDGVILGRFVGANALASVNLILPCYSLIVYRDRSRVPDLDRYKPRTFGSARGE